MEKLVPYLIDTTLRDGEQAPGVVFDIHDKLRIAELLEKTGITETEVGTPALGRSEVEDIKTIAESGFSFSCLAWCRALRKDIYLAKQTGVQGVHISFPVSELHLLSIGKNRQWLMSTLNELSVYARNNFSYFSIGAQDASRADETFLKEFISNASLLGAKRVRIADTVGILHPLKTAQLFSEISSLDGIRELEFHGHNDLGMATANTVSALLSGAHSASVTVNGLGERAGNASLEEVVLAMEIAAGERMPYTTEYLGELSLLVSELSGKPIHDMKPVTGTQALRHESGIHTRGLLFNPKTYQIIEAEKIGRRETDFVIGKHSGSAAILDFAQKHAIVVSKEKLPVVMNEIKRSSINFKRSLSDVEVMEIIKVVMELS